MSYTKQLKKWKKKYLTTNNIQLLTVGILFLTMVVSFLSIQSEKEIHNDEQYLLHPHFGVIVKCPGILTSGGFTDEIETNIKNYGKYSSYLYFNITPDSSAINYDWETEYTTHTGQQNFTWFFGGGEEQNFNIDLNPDWSSNEDFSINLSYSCDSIKKSKPCDFWTNNKGENKYNFECKYIYYRNKVWVLQQ